MISSYSYSFCERSRVPFSSFLLLLFLMVIRRFRPFFNALDSWTCFPFQFAIYGIESKKNIVYYMQLTPIGWVCVRTLDNCNGYYVSVDMCLPHTNIYNMVCDSNASENYTHRFLAHTNINNACLSMDRSGYCSFFLCVCLIVKHRNSIHCLHWFIITCTSTLHNSCNVLPKCSVFHFFRVLCDV